ncbi:MAG TPA: hypothetical protein DD670_04620 [Planctomycetaceae bacterium]|nr:hypothetical protein [Planctomycetaceae bacterium]
MTGDLAIRVLKYAWTSASGWWCDIASDRNDRNECAGNPLRAVEARRCANRKKPLPSIDALKIAMAGDRQQTRRAT